MSYYKRDTLFGNAGSPAVSWLSTTSSIEPLNSTEVSLIIVVLNHNDGVSHFGNARLLFSWFSPRSAYRPLRQREVI